MKLIEARLAIDTIQTLINAVCLIGVVSEDRLLVNALERVGQRLTGVKYVVSSRLPARVKPILVDVNDFGKYVANECHPACSVMTEIIRLLRCIVNDLEVCDEEED